MSPTVNSFVLVVGVVLLGRRTVFFMTGWVKRRSTRTTTVLSCLSLTTTPCSVRFGICLASSLRFRLRARALWRFLAGSARAMVLMRRDVLIRAMSRRTCRTRAVFSSCPVARWKRRLNCSFFSLSTSSSSWSTVIARTSPAFIGRPRLLRDALDEARLDRQLGGGRAPAPRARPPPTRRRPRTGCGRA